MHFLNQKMKTAMLLACILLLPKVASALGDDGITIELGVTGVGQQISKRNGDIDKEATESVDLVIDADMGFGVLHIYGEAASTADTSASSLVAGSNADAGTAAKPNGRGRGQLSEISFSTDISMLNINFGVIDLTGFADATATANDEGVQFLANTLVNNPTIAFPDYTPAVVVNYGEEDAIQFTALTANAYGLGDNPRGNYAQLFKFNRTPSGEKKGLFSLAEIRMPVAQADLLLTLGGWHSSMEVARYDGTGNDKNTFGGYVNLDSQIGDTAYSIRGGYNNAKTEITGGVKSFGSLSIEHVINEQHAFGAGVAYSGLHNDYKNALTGTGANTTVTEIYYRWQITDAVAISPDIQYHHNANNLSSGAANTVFGNVWVYGVRMTFGASYQLAHKN